MKLKMFGIIYIISIILVVIGILFSVVIGIIQKEFLLMVLSMCFYLLGPFFGIIFFVLNILRS